MTQPAAPRQWPWAVAVLVLLSLVGAQGVLGWVIDGLGTDAALLNVSGRQRMLSQRLANQSQQLSAAVAAADREKTAARIAALDATLRAWTSAHAGLVSRDPSLGLGGSNSPEVAVLLRSLEADRQAAVESARALGSLAPAAVADPRRRAEADALSRATVASAERFLPVMQEVVGTYEREAHRHVALLSRMRITVGLVTLALILVAVKLTCDRAARGLQEQGTELRESNEGLTLALEGTTHGVWDWNVVTNAVAFSPRYIELLGYAPDDPEFPQALATFMEHLHPDDVAYTEAAIKRSLSHGDPIRLLYRLRMKSGAYRWFEASGATRFDPTGRPVRMAGTISDVEEARAAQAALAIATASLEEAQALARLGNWSFDLASGKVTWSSQVYRLFGRDPADGPPSYAEILAAYVPEDGARLETEVARLVADGTSYALTLRTADPSIPMRHVRAVARAQREGGKVTGIFGTVMDVTDEVEREATLRVARNDAEAANRSKSAFLANMSHEIRTPLTAILGFADLLRDAPELAARPERLRLVDTIKDAGAHLLVVINDILDLSKIEADRMTLERVEASLPGLLAEVVDLIGPRARHKGVLLEARLVTPLPERIATDPTRLRQILMNLAGNAAKFTEAGSITLAARVQPTSGGPELVVDVEDTGAGMTEEESGRLFVPFGQADETVTRKHGGTGLGLTICRRLARMMGGDVELVKSEPGRGSTFRLWLPLQPAAGTATVTQLEVRPPRALALSLAPARIALKGRILLAEDGLDNQQLIAFHLRKAGATVEIADNGQVALAMLDQASASGAPYDLLLTDMQMPEMDGYTLARTLRERGSALPIIALTAHAMAEDRGRCREAGCDDYATKPIDKATLLGTCAAWLGKRGGARPVAA